MARADEGLIVSDVRVRRTHGGRATRIAFLLVAFGIFGVLTGVSFATHFTLMPVLLGIPFMLAVVVMLFRRRATIEGEERGTLRVSDGVVTLDGARVASAKELDAAWVAPYEATTKVLLRARRGLGAPAELFVHRQQDARAIVRALGLDVDRRTASIDVRSEYASGTLPAIVLLSQTATFWRTLGAPHGPLPAWAMPIWVVLLSAWLVVGLASRRVTIGRDGVRIGWLGRRRFIPHADISSVNHTENSVVLQLVGGETIELPLRPKTRAIDEATRDAAIALRDRIERARARDVEPTPLPPHALEPASRSLAEWVTDLRRSDAVPTFRDGAPIDDAQLWRVVEDGGGDHAQRAAAAVVLSRALDDEGKRRLRVAADTSADPKLRVALQAAADDDEPSMVRAIDRLHRARRATR